MSLLTPVQLANVATLASFIQNIPEAEYNHRWINADIRPMEGQTTAICASGHAAKNRERFFRPAEAPAVQPWYERLFGIQPRSSVARYAPEAFDYDTVDWGDAATERRDWAVEAFGYATWEAVFSTYAFDDVAQLPTDVTPRMVANRLNQIARDGYATAEPLAA